MNELNRPRQKSGSFILLVKRARVKRDWAAVEQSFMFNEWYIIFYGTNVIVIIDMCVEIHPLFSKKKLLSIIPLELECARLPLCKVAA